MAGTEAAKGSPFGALVRRHRQAAALSQEALAECAGLSKDAISVIERGKRGAPRPETVALLARALDLSAEERAALIAAARAVGAAPDKQVSPHTIPLALPPLPVPLTAFIGREREIASVRERLLDPRTRLVTLTGPGGTGKTRLALEVARGARDAFFDGVTFVSLAALTDHHLVLPTIMQALGLREMADRVPMETLAMALAGARLLLVLDNLEQVVASAPALVTALAAAPDVTILATSRTRLGIAGECIYPVDPLHVPSPSDAAHVAALEQVEAVRLYVERAQAVAPTFALTSRNARAVAAICARLDGLPLAIELAAAWSRHLTAEALLRRLDRSLTLLTRGARDAPQRQQTLRETIAWSYELLDEPVRALFRRVSVFAGGCTVDAVRAVCAGVGTALPEDDVLAGLAALADQSLLLVGEGADGDPRFWMLETVREYGGERLEAGGEMPALRRAHARYYLTLAEEAAPELTGPRQIMWLARLEREHDNLRAALRWALEGGDAEYGVRLAGALWRFWWFCSHQSEGRRWLDVALARSVTAPPALRARALQGAGQLAINQGDYERATALSAESLALFRAVDDRPGVALVLSNLGEVARELGDYERGADLLGQSLALYEQLGYEQGIAETLHALGQLSLWQGDYARAANQFEEGLSLARGAGNKMTLASFQRDLGLLAYFQGDTERARGAIAESLHLFRDLGDKTGITACVIILAGIAGASGHLERAATLLGAAEALGETVAMWLPPPAHAAYDREVGDLRRAMGEDAFAAAWAAGRGLPPEETMAYALRETRIQEGND